LIVVTRSALLDVLFPLREIGQSSTVASLPAIGFGKLSQTVPS